jgi:hypothetical protein
MVQKFQHLVARRRCNPPRLSSLGRITPMRLLLLSPLSLALEILFHFFITLLILPNCVIKCLFHKMCHRIRLRKRKMSRVSVSVLCLLSPLFSNPGIGAGRYSQSSQIRPFQRLPLCRENEYPIST